MEMIELQIQIFLLLLLGWFLGRKKILSKSTSDQLNTLVMNVILPCSIFRSFTMDITLDVFKTTGMILLLSIAIQAASLLLGKVLWLKAKDVNERTNLDFGTAANNAGTLGMVISQAAFGQIGVLYSSIYMIPVRITMWSYGLSLYSRDSEKQTWKGLVHVLLHPCLIAIYLGVLWMFASMAGWELPGFVSDTIGALANCNTAMIMIVIGTILSDLKAKDLAQPLVWIYTVFRLVLFPAVIFLILHCFSLPAIVINLCTLEAAMPAPVTMAMLAKKYGKAPEFASRMILVSTLASMITLPLWTWVFSLI